MLEIRYVIQFLLLVKKKNLMKEQHKLQRNNVSITPLENV